MAEWCSIDDVRIAYLDCMRHKANTSSCSEFRRKELYNLYTLHEDLVNKTYKIGQSDAFCVTYPKVREVFAAQFRDRIVHHLVMLRLNDIFEEYFIEDTYNCRKGKGTDFGIHKALEYSNKHKGGWVAKCDIQGFFMHINRKLLADMLEDFIRDRYHKSDVEEIVWLVRMIATNSPEKNCRKKGNLSLWKSLPRDKSLFTNEDGYGLAIGNLTSQVFANFFLSVLDFEMTSIKCISYGRYVDDFFIFADDKYTVFKAIEKAREVLAKLGLTLHPNKVYCQPIHHGITFVGTTIKNGRLYSGNRTVGNAFKLVRYYNRFVNKEEFIESFSQRYNSISGYLMNRSSYAIRYNLWNEISNDVKQYVYIEDMYILKVRNEYKKVNKQIAYIHDKKRDKNRRMV